MTTGMPSGAFDLSPEAVERLARDMEDYPVEQPEVAATLRALSAERDALRAENQKLRGWLELHAQDKRK